MGRHWNESSHFPFSLTGLSHVAHRLDVAVTFSAFGDARRLDGRLRRDSCPIRVPGFRSRAESDETSGDSPLSWFCFITYIFFERAHCSYGERGACTVYSFRARFVMTMPSMTGKDKISIGEVSCSLAVMYLQAFWKDVALVKRLH